MVGGPPGAALGAGAGATAQGIEAGDSFFNIAVSAAGSYFAAGSIANGWTNAFREMTVEQAQAAGLTGASGVGAAGTGGTLAASQAALGVGTTNTVINAGLSAEAYANAANIIRAGGSLTGINPTVLKGLLNNTAFMNSLSQPIFASTNLKAAELLTEAATTTGSKVVDAAIQVLDTTGKYTGTVNAEGLATTGAATADAVTKTIEAKEQALKQENSKYILVYGNSWHQGVLGIIASKILEIYYKPVIVISFLNKIGVGSARSIDNVDLGKIIFHAKHENIIISG